MTILNCVFSGKIYESKILHELWAFLQTHPSLHIMYKSAERIYCDHYNFAEFRPDAVILGTHTARCMYTTEIISIFH